MKDAQILDLYWERQEQAIYETQKAYGNYCYSIAWNILYSREEFLEAAVGFGMEK